VTKEIKTIEIVPGYDQPSMGRYLTAMKAEVKKALTERTLSDVLSGKAADAGDFRPGPFDWSADQWRAIKDRAVALGILPNVDTGMLSALKACSKTHGRWAEAKEPKAKDKARRKSLAALARLAKALLELRQCEHPAMKEYLETAAAEVKKRIETRTREG